MQESKSALKNHFLKSVLPYQETREQEYFIKNKQFYKPESFIWNNPHRTSKRLYPYFHQAREQYELKIKPTIDKLEEQDRIEDQQSRIKKLSMLRMETRERFFERQKSREQLQAKSNSKTRTKSITDLDSKTSRIDKNIHLESLKANFGRQHSQSNHIVVNIEKTFQKGVQKYDEELSKIKTMVNEQIVKNHYKIRLHFQKRKQTNDIFNRSVSKIKGRKSVGVLKHDNYFNT